MSKAIKWLSRPEEHDYPAAESYLSLLRDDAAALVKKLRAAPIATFKAKDVIRAARLPLLTDENRHVAKDLKKIERGEALSPLLLVRDTAHGRLIIADGYHRACAAYCLDEDADIRCGIV